MVAKSAVGAVSLAVLCAMRLRSKGEPEIRCELEKNDEKRA
jgi:hypothetical protein